MSRREVGSAPTRRIDWRGWVMVAWVALFGSLYARMVIESRAPKVRELVRSIAARVVE